MSTRHRVDRRDQPTSLTLFMIARRLHPELDEYLLLGRNPVETNIGPKIVFERLRIRPVRKHHIPNQHPPFAQFCRTLPQRSCTCSRCTRVRDSPSSACVPRSTKGGVPISYACGARPETLRNRRRYWLKRVPHLVADVHHSLHNASLARLANLRLHHVHVCADHAIGSTWTPCCDARPLRASSRRAAHQNILKSSRCRIGILAAFSMQLAMVYIQSPWPWHGKEERTKFDSYPLRRNLRRIVRLRWRRMPGAGSGADQKVRNREPDVMSSPTALVIILYYTIHIASLVTFKAQSVPISPQVVHDLCRLLQLAVRWSCPSNHAA